MMLHVVNVVIMMDFVIVVSLSVRKSALLIMFRRKQFLSIARNGVIKSPGVILSDLLF